jgi:hypothetical protein
MLYLEMLEHVIGLGHPVVVLVILAAAAAAAAAAATSAAVAVRSYPTSTS